MTTASLADRICAVLAAACAGDALGAATEGMHVNDIVREFGGPVTTLRPAPARAPFAGGMTPGRLTDDATQMLCMAEEAIRMGGALDRAGAIRGMLAWMEDTESFTRFAGPTTRVALEKLKSGVAPEDVADPGVYSCMFGTSNGAAMRAPVAGCLNPGGIEAAAKLATVLSSPTHNTQIAYAGAGAVAGAIAHGLGGGDIADLVDVAVSASLIAQREAELNGRVVGGASVVRRIELAASIGRQYIGDLQIAMLELETIIGNGVAMAEAVPTAIGLVVAAMGSPKAAIDAAVNGGNDSDTIAMFAGAIAAAYLPLDLDPAIITTIEAVNGIDLTHTATQFATLLEARA